MPGRSFTVEDYRYGFNGMEVDDEIRGEGNSLDFGARMYDPRVGRFFSTDAMSGDFPNQSPYAFAANSPVYATDLNGDSVWVTITETGRTIRDDGKVVIHHSAVIHITVSVLDMSGTVWTCLGLDGPIWRNLGLSKRPIWAYLVP